MIRATKPESATPTSAAPSHGPCPSTIGNVVGLQRSVGTTERSERWADSGHLVAFHRRTCQVVAARKARMVSNCRLGDAGQRAAASGDSIETLAPVQEGQTRLTLGQVLRISHLSQARRPQVGIVSSHVGDSKRVKWLDQRHITLLSIGTITLAESLPEVGWVKQVHAVQEGWQLFTN